MGLMSKILGDQAGSRNTEDYVELDADEIPSEGVNASNQVRIANIGEKQDVIDIKDAVYDGDIVQKDDDQLIITPSGIKISRQRLGE